MFSNGWTPDNIPADVLESLAKNEHVRVCRYLRAHGYCYAPVDNEKIRHTRALVEWDELDGRYKQFYRLMARASLS